MCLFHQAYFEDNPRDLQVLRHDKDLHPTRIQPHLKNVPEYLGKLFFAVILCHDTLSISHVAFHMLCFSSSHSSTFHGEIFSEEKTSSHVITKDYSQYSWWQGQFKVEVPQLALYCNSAFLEELCNNYW